MEFNDIINKFLSICKDYKGIKKIILFGSYAKGNNHKTSDIDIAISGEFDYFDLIDRIENEIYTLRSFDIIEYDNIINKKFKKEIDNYGKTLYEI